MHLLQYSVLGLWHVVLSVAHLFALSIHRSVFNKIHVSLGQSLEQFERRRHPRLFLSYHRSSLNDGTAIHLPVRFMLLSYLDRGILYCILDEEWSLETIVAIWTDFLPRRGFVRFAYMIIRCGDCFRRCFWLIIRLGTRRSFWSFCTFQMELSWKCSSSANDGVSSCYAHGAYLCNLVHVISRIKSILQFPSQCCFRDYRVLDMACCNRIFLDHLPVLPSLLWRTLHYHGSPYHWDDAKRNGDIQPDRFECVLFSTSGFIIPRRYLPLIYTFLTFVNNGTLMCQLFGMLWGSLYLRLARVLVIYSLWLIEQEPSSHFPALQDVRELLFFHIDNIASTSRTSKC